VSKTLTIEGLSEYLKRPLYVVYNALLVYLVILTFQISARELGQDAKILEEKLSTIFRLAHHWKAILLLDEADVFV
jgi:hypothetical protein